MALNGSPEFKIVKPAKFHDFSVMLMNLKDSHYLTIVFWKKTITQEFKE